MTECLLLYGTSLPKQILKFKIGQMTDEKDVFIIRTDGKIEYHTLNMFDIKLQHSILLGCLPELKIGMYYMGISKQEALVRNIPHNKLASNIIQKLYNANRKHYKYQIYGDAILYHLDRNFEIEDWDTILFKIA